MSKIKFDKKIMMASFSKTFGHVIRPINPDKVKRISIDEYFKYVKKNAKKYTLKKYEKYHGVLRRMPKHCWIIWIEDCRLQNGTITDGFIIAFDEEAREITDIDLIGIFDLSNAYDTDQDDDSDEDPDRDDDGDEDEPIVSDSYMSCFCANSTNCSCVSTVTSGPSPGDSCSSDNDCGGTGTSPNPFDELVILGPNDW